MTSSPHPSRRSVLQAGAFAAGSLALFTACSEGAPGLPTAETSAPTAPPTTQATTAAVTDSWAPQPRTVGDLTVTASQAGEELVLHTLDGDRVFWAGVGLSAAFPGHLPEDHAVDAETYGRWFRMMREVGVRVVRLDRLQDPTLYSALHAHNTEHTEDPLYVLQGVTVDEIEDAPDDAPFGSAATEAFLAEIADTSAAVHGDLTRGGGDATGPTGTWSDDVSPWVAGWIVGNTWNPGAVVATDEAAETDSETYDGTYFSAVSGATATESLIARLMDRLAEAEAEAGRSAPIAAAGHPEVDPLTHTEAVEGIALADIDVNRIQVHTTWPAGSFAAYRAYPFAPDFIERQPDYAGDDPYRAYLLDLRQHHRGLPMMITEFGVPASIGQSALASAGRDGGFLSEQQAMSVNAGMLTMFRDMGLAGGLLTSWTDSWGVPSRSTRPRHAEVDPARRVLWHDPLSSDQWFGLLAHDSERVGPTVVHDEPDHEMTRVTVDHDASFLYLTLFFTRRVTSPVEIGFDLFDGPGLRLPGGTGDAAFDLAIHLTPTMSTVTVFVRRTLDPVRLDGLPTLYLPRSNARGWVQQQVLVRPPLSSGDGPTAPARMQKVGTLLLGNWDPASPASTSLATWQLVRPDATRPMEFRLRLPWSMLAQADPSAKQGLVPELGMPTLVGVDTMRVMVESSTPGSPAFFEIDWDGWDEVTTTERLRAGMSALTDAFGAVGGTTNALDQ